MSLAIIDSGGANISSVSFACRRLGAEPVFTGDPDVIAAADRVILPGVGAAKSAMDHLRSRDLVECIRGLTQPVLGICLGLQISLDYSEENDTRTLGLISGRVRRFKFDSPDMKVPHMGWNEVRPVRAHPVLADIEAGDEFYFVHGYYPDPQDAVHVYALTDYEHDFASAVGKDNYIATQFHPEKSGRVGLRLLRNFANWNGQC